MNKLKRLALFLAILTLSSCATEIASIKKDDDTKLAAKEGYLLLSLDTNLDMEKIYISGSKFLELNKSDLIHGSHFIIAKLPEGEYHIYRINLTSWLRFDDFSSRDWSFTIHPGYINYVGNLELEYHGNPATGIYSYMLMENRSSFALEFIERNYKPLLSQYKMTYTGPGEDGFFEFINNKKENEK